MKIVFNEQEVACSNGKSVLDSLLAAGHDIPNSCKSGVCHSCVLQAVSGEPCIQSQEGLKPNQQDLGYFKSCVCYPKSDMVVSFGEELESQLATISHKQMLNKNTLLLRLTVKGSFDFKGGQFISLIRQEDGLKRSYSIASLPSEGFLELHIRCFDEGKMSSWLRDVALIGDELLFNGPYGDCYYRDGSESQDLLLAGIGTGMAPLYAIARDALAKGHKGHITVVQGAANESGLYHLDEFAAVSTFQNVTYIPSTVDGSGGYKMGKIDDVVKGQFGDLKGYRVFLCGSVNTVNRLKRYSFLAGASMSDILSDPFTPSGEV